MTAQREVLILRARGLGDFMTGLPAYRGLRRHFAHHRIVLAAPGELADLVRLSGAFDELLPTRTVDELRWQRPAPDVAVNLHDKGPRSHEALLSLSPRRRIGFRAPGWSGPTWEPEEHDVNRWCRLLESAGVAADPTHLRLPAPAVATDLPGVVVIHPGAASPSRRWPANRYGEVARRLTANGCQVVITGSTQERRLAQVVAGHAGLPPEAVVAGNLDLLEFATLIAGARLLICGDTGPAHIATAYATPSVLLFGALSPRLWGPPPHQPRHRVLWYGPLRSDPWGSQPDSALLAITVDQVSAAARHQLHPRISNGFPVIAKAVR